MNPKQREDAIEAALSRVATKRSTHKALNFSNPPRNLSPTGTRLERLERTLARAQTGLEQARKERSTMQSNYYLPLIENLEKDIKAEKEKQQ